MATPFHSRADWGARPARSVTRRFLSEDTAHYGGPSPWGPSVDRSSPARFYETADHARCATIVRAYQAFHLDSRGWSDIAYSSLVCPHGHRYEGRGPDVRTAAQGTTLGNDTSHATCYLAGEGDPLTPQAMAAYVDESRRLRGLTKGHRDWKSTACPGDPLYRWVHSNQQTPQPEDDFVDKNTFMAWFDEALDNHARIHGIAGGARPWFGRAFGYVYKGARDATATRATVNSIAKKVDALADVDEAEVARLVLAGFDPAAIAAAIPPELAAQVAVHLSENLPPELAKQVVDLLGEKLTAPAD